MDNPAEILRLMNIPGGTLSAKPTLTPTGPRKGTIVRQSDIANNLMFKEAQNNNAASNNNKFKGKVVEVGHKNILNNYTSYTYKFTLASLPKKALSDQDFYKNNKNLFIIAKSGGKGTSAANTATSSPEYEALVQGFNQNSPGRFDFYINNVRINTVCGGSIQTNMSIATSIEFDIFEPYSMTGFLEALHVSAVSADHDSYINCPYLLKMEFVGYRDDNDKIEKIPYSTRYFVFRFTQVEIDVNETGTRYRCAGVPTNELAFGNQAGKLMDNVLCVGNTVKDLLASLSLRITQQKRDEMQEVTKDLNSGYDTYKIEIQNDDKNLISEASTVHFLKQNQNFDFITEEDKLSYINSKTNSLGTYMGIGDNGLPIFDPVPSAIAAQFGKNYDIVDIISSIVRDSSYVRRILQTPTPDEEGYIDYFIILVEVKDRSEYNEFYHRPFRDYRYIVRPYKIHYTRIQPLSEVAIDTTVAAAYVQKSYDYLYTGKNVDIEKFRLKFNTLYFQAIPPNLGNKPGYNIKPGGVESETTPDAKLTKIPKSEVQKSVFGIAPVTAVPDRGGSNIDGTPNATQAQIDPYYDLAKNMHQGILENVDQSTGELEIIGDPYYLVTDTMGNQSLPITQTSSGGMIAGDGEAPYAYQDLNIVIRFNMPTDINQKNGLIYFEEFGETKTKVAAYSGVFRVIQVTSTFNDGVFKQILQFVRIPGQVEETSAKPSNSPTTVDAVPVPERTPKDDPVSAPSTMRGTENTLGNTIQSQLNSSKSIKGLPGSLSNLVPGGVNSLAGAAVAGLTVASIINSLKSGASNNVGSLVNRVSGLPASGLSNVGSSIRLANAGLSALSSNVNQVGGSVNEISNTARSLGLSNVTPSNLSKTLLDHNNNLTSSLGSSQIAKVTNLSSKAAGLMSNASSNINNLNGNFVALEGQLGINSSVISGLSPNLKSKILKTITDAVNKIPNNVDVNAEIQNGLNINNLSIDGLANIPPTQPKAIAPTPKINPSDLRYIVNRGGNLNNISADASNLDKIVDNIKLSNVSSVGNKPQVVADKLTSIQSGLNRVTNTKGSKEAEINNISKITGDNVPNVGNLSQSAASKYGSKSSGGASILTALIKASQK